MFLFLFVSLFHALPFFQGVLGVSLPVSIHQTFRGGVQHTSPDISHQTERPKPHVRHVGTRGGTAGVMVFQYESNKGR